MKAQAKKILALIMAMVMCLSLAAPAFASGSYSDGKWTITNINDDDVFATTTDASVYKAKTTHITRIEADDVADTWTVYGWVKDSTYATGTSIAEEPIAGGKATDTKLPNYLEIVETPAVSLIGKKQTAAKYTVKLKDSLPSGVSKEATVAPAEITVGDDNPAPKSFDDVKDSWTPMASEQVFKAASGTYYQVSGSIYQEPQGNGLVKAYFKLNPVNADGNGFDTTKDPIYLVNPTAHAAYSEAQYGEALADAVKCNIDGTATSEAIATMTKKDGTGVAIAVDKTDDAFVFYGYTAWTESKALSVSGTNAEVTGGTTTKNGTLTVTFDAASEQTSATFNVQIKATTVPTTGKETNAYVTNVDEATKLLKKAGYTNCKLESVAASSGNTLVVTVTKTVTQKYSTDTDVKYAKNVWFVDGTEEALLIDMDKEGFYNATSAQGANALTIEAGKKALGPVLVKASQVNNTSKYTVTETKNASLKDNSNTYYVFDSVEAMQNGIEARSCTDGKDIEYIQTYLNPYKGSKKNGLVNEVKKKVTVTDNENKKSDKNLVDDTLAQVDKSGTGYVAGIGSVAKSYDYEMGTSPVGVMLASDWWTKATATSNADFVEKGTWTVAAAKHGIKVKVVKTTAKTCETAGSEVTETICTVCNQVLETSEPKVIPADANPLEKSKAGSEDEPEKYAFGEGDTTHKSSHWAEKYVTKTVPTADKTGTVITTTLYCNYGKAHDVYTITLNKNSLQNSGRWNHFSIDGRNADQVLNSSGDAIGNMFGYEDGITIADSDVEMESLTLNRKFTNIPKDNRTTVDKKGNDLTIKFPKDTFSGTSGLTVVENADKSKTAYTTVTLDDVYATATAKPVTKYYVATLTAKVTKERYYDCQTGMATLTAQVYEVADSKDTQGWTSATKYVDAVAVEDNLAKNLKNGKVTLLQTYTMDNIVIRAKKFHEYDEKTSICRNCLEGVQAVEDVKFDATTITVGSLNWTGKAAQPKVTVYDTKGNKLLKGIDYVVEQVEETDAGEHTITVVGQNDYQASRATVPYTINKVAGTLKKKSAPSKLTASATKKVTGQIKMTVTGGKVAKYKVTKKVGGVSVNKSGKITVKKANKKAGTLKVKVTMTPDANHTAAKAVTIKVAIKAAPAAKKTTKK